MLAAPAPATSPKDSQRGNRGIRAGQACRGPSTGPWHRPQEHEQKGREKGAGSVAGCVALEKVLVVSGPWLPKLK